VVSEVPGASPAAPPTASTAVIRVPGGDYPVVPLPLLKRPTTTRDDLMRMCRDRVLSFHAADNKTRLIQILTKHFQSIATGEAATAKSYVNFLKKEQLKHPRLLLFQVALLSHETKVRPSVRIHDRVPVAAVPPDSSLPAGHDSLSADDEAHVRKLAGADASEPVLGAFRTAFVMRKRESGLAATLEGMRTDIANVGARVTAVSTGMHRGLQDVRHTIAFTAAHGATGKRLCECGNLFGRAKKRVRSYSAAVAAMQQKEAGSDLHATKAGDSDEIRCRQAGAAPVVAAVVEGAPGAPPGSVIVPVAPEGLPVSRADGFFEAPELLDDMVTGVGLIEQLQRVVGWCHTEPGHPSVFGTIAVAQTYDAWRLGQVKIHGRRPPTVNAAMTTKMKNMQTYAVNFLRIVLWLKDDVPVVLGALADGAGRTRAQALAIKISADQRVAIFSRMQHDADLVNAPMTDKIRAGDAATITQLKLLLQGVAKRNKAFVPVGSTQVTVPTMKHAAVAPWIERARKNLPPCESPSSMSSVMLS